MTEKETTLFLRRFPEKLKRDLKAEAARQGRHMIDLVIEYIAAGLKTNCRKCGCEIIDGVCGCK